MGKRFGNEVRLILMFLLTTSFFLVEIIVGYVSNSMALVADSFHMLSDVVALIIAFIAIMIAPKKWSKSTFGWARAEVLGALINSVFLLALCFSIVVESLKRFYSIEKIDNPLMVFIVGLVGLAVNLIGLVLFAGHGHAHHGHAHSHSHRTKDSIPTPELVEGMPMRGANAYVLKDGTEVLADLSEDQCEQEYCEEEMNSKNGTSNSEKAAVQMATTEKPVIVSVNGMNSAAQAQKKERAQKATNMNMQGVFLHILGDALGSVIVVVSAAVVQWTTWEYKDYLDPVLSIVMALIITRSTWPLLIESAMVLLQTVPTHIDVREIEKKLLAIDGVQGVHEFHVWRLTGDRIIASAHITFLSLADYMRIAGRVKRVFHDEGIHSTTIQPEALELHQNAIMFVGNADKMCTVNCPPENNCETSTCCPPLPPAKEVTVRNEVELGTGKNRSERGKRLDASNVLAATLLDSGPPAPGVRNHGDTWCPHDDKTNGSHPLVAQCSASETCDTCDASNEKTQDYVKEFVV